MARSAASQWFMVSGTSTRSPGLATPREEVARLGLEREPRARVAVRLGDRPHGRQPLQVQQRDADHGERRAPARAGGARAPARTGRRARRAAARSARTATARRTRRSARRGTAARPPTASAARARAAPRRRRRSRASARTRSPRSGRCRPRGTADRARSRPPASGARPTPPSCQAGRPSAISFATAPSIRNTPATGLASIAASPSTPESTRRCRARGRPRADGERDPEQERHPPDRHVGQHAGREQPRGDRARGRRRRRRARERRRTARRRPRRSSTPTNAGPERRRQRREQQRVAEHVMAAVPLRVPDRQALVLEQPRAVGVRGHVGGRRLSEQVRHADQRAAQRRRQRVLERAPHGGRDASGRHAARLGGEISGDEADARRSALRHADPAEPAREHDLAVSGGVHPHLHDRSALQPLIHARFSPTRRDAHVAAHRAGRRRRGPACCVRSIDAEWTSAARARPPLVRRRGRLWLARTLFIARTMPASVRSWRADADALDGRQDADDQ